MNSLILSLFLFFIFSTVFPSSITPSPSPRSYFYKSINAKFHPNKGFVYQHSCSLKLNITKKIICPYYWNFVMFGVAFWLSTIFLLINLVKNVRYVNYYIALSMLPKRTKSGENWLHELKLLIYLAVYGFLFEPWLLVFVPFKVIVSLANKSNTSIPYIMLSEEYLLAFLYFTVNFAVF